MTNVIERLIHREHPSLSAAQMPDLLAQVDEYVDEPSGADLFLGLAGHPDTASALPLAQRMLTITSDPGVMAEIASSMAHDPEPLRFLPFAGNFLQRVVDRGVNPGVRSHALHAAMILGTPHLPTFHRLIATLLEIDGQDDPGFLRHAARVIGAISQATNEVGLLPRLAEIAGVDGARDEAAVALGCERLRAALRANSPHSALAALTEARGWFEEAQLAAEERLDAMLMERCAGMLIAFHEGDTGADLAERIAAIRDAASQWSAYLGGSHAMGPNSWLTLRETERIAWVTLAVRLGNVDVSLARTPWLNAATIIEEQLAAVFAAGDTFFKGADGVDQLLRPRLVRSLSQDRIFLDLIDRWLEDNGGRAPFDAVRQLRDDVGKARAAVIERHPTEAATGSATVAAIPDRFAQIAGESESARIEFNAAAMASQNVSPAVEAVLQNCVAALSGSSAFMGKTRKFVEVALMTLLKYARSRHDTSVATLPSMQFLYERDVAKLPLEKDIQQDLFQFLLGASVSHLFQAEARDLAGGRVDILLKNGGMTLSAELKREFDDLDNEQMIGRYGAQAAAYQSTNIPFAFLVVLDLFDRGGQQWHLMDQVSVHRVTPLGGRTETFLTLLRVQGRRLRPSEQKTVGKVRQTKKLNLRKIRP